MLPANAKIQSLTRKGYFGPAEVLDCCDGKYRVKIPSKNRIPGKNSVQATPALPFPCDLKWGDTVLIAGEDAESFFIIGVIHARTFHKTLTLKDGTTVEAVDKDGAEQLKVCSKQNGMIFEYDAETGKTSVNLQKGDLEILTPNGCIDFAASKGIRFYSENPIEMKSRQHIRLAAVKLETVVETVVEKAKNVYQTVERLIQLRTGRMRTLVDGTTHIKTHKAFYKAEEDFKIKSKKIHLG